jgi:hypothetical protein
MPLREPKTTLVVLLKSGASITTKCVSSKQEIETGYNTARQYQADGGVVDLRIETGDDKNNIMYFRCSEISLLSIMDYVDEKKAAASHGIMKPNSGLIVPR